MLLYYILILTVSIMTFSCQNLISVCPLDRNSGDSLQKLKREIFCNETMNCTLIMEVLARDYNDFVVLYHERHQLNKTKTIVDSLSGCRVKSVVLDKINSTMAKLCMQNKTTIIVDLTNDEFFSSIDPSSSMQNCYNKVLQDGYQYVEDFLENCRSTLWLTKNVHCDLLESHSYILKVVKLPDIAETNVYHQTFRVTTVHYPPYVSKTVMSNGTTKYQGIVFEILDEIAEQYQFNYTVVEPENENYGILLNNSWTGMVGMLHNNEVDVIAAGLTVTYSRSTVAEFSLAFYTDPISIMIHDPDKPQMLWRLLSLFSSLTWLSIFIAAAVSVIVMFLLHKYSALDSDTGLESIHQCIWYVACCLTNQGVDNQPKMWSGQNFLAAWCLAAFVLISMYSGGLIAMLTTSRLSTPFKDLKGLIDKLEWNEYVICIENGTSLYDTILHSDFEDYNRIKDWLDKNPSYVQDNDESCTKSFLNTKNMAYLGELSFLKNLQKEHCVNTSLIILPDEFLTGDFAFALQKNSPLNSIISSKIQNAKETGLIESWENTYSEKRPFCKIKEANEKTSTGMDRLALKSFVGAFIILVMGLFFSFLAFIGEIYRTELGSCIYTFFSWTHYKFRKVKPIND